jgi:hypothetical protein
VTRKKEETRLNGVPKKVAFLHDKKIERERKRNQKRLIGELCIPWTPSHHTLKMVVAVEETSQREIHSLPFVLDQRIGGERMRLGDPFLTRRRISGIVTIRVTKLINVP